MRTIRLVTYQPLCYNLLGMEAIKRGKFLPFIDSSCRREPDFDNIYPSISGLCRKNKLAPQLVKGDIVVYLTKPGKFNCSSQHLSKGVYKLSGILEVVDVFKNHADAGEWYSINRINLPSNCLVSGNEPKSFFETGGNFSSQREIKELLNLEQEKQSRIADLRVKAWDRQYQQRAEEFSNFVITRPVFLDIHNPIPIERCELVDWFGKVPGTQTPKILSEQQYERILARVKPKFS